MRKNDGDGIRAKDRERASCATANLCRVIKNISVLDDVLRGSTIAR